MDRSKNSQPESTMSLENQLRGMILGNESSSQESTSTSRGGLASQIPSSQRDVSVNNPANPVPQSQSRGQSRSRRPNQAQRRQLSAQLDITPAFHSLGLQTPRASQFLREPEPNRANNRGTNRGKAGVGRAQGAREGQQHRPSNSHQFSGPPIQQQHGRSPEYHRKAARNDFHQRPPQECSWEEMENQAKALEHQAWIAISAAEMPTEEIVKQDKLRLILESICQEALEADELCTVKPENVSLQCFGSLKSGFATKSSDMDLALLTLDIALSSSAKSFHVPRVIEKALLNASFGARLLTRTRVPIIKFCESPSEKLLTDLREARQKWETEPSDTEETEPEQHQDDDQNTHDAVGKDGMDNIVFKSKETQQSTETNDGVNGRAEVTDMEHIQSISQKTGEPLAQYHRRAKRLLERAGVQDVHHANLTPLSSKDRRIMYKICKMFISGLENKAVAGRLLSHRSLDFDEAETCGRTISLFGAWMQSEGESLVFMCENRTIKEHTARKEDELQAAVREWELLQRTASTKATHYNKLLRNAVEGLKMFASVRLSCLRQERDEPADDYKYRALKILTDMRVEDHTQDEPMIPNVDERLHAIIRQFVAGIYLDSVKAETAAFLSRSGFTSLQDATAQFQAETTAHMFSQVMRKDANAYTQSNMRLIADFVSLMRQYGATSTVPHVLVIYQKLKWELRNPAQVLKSAGDRFTSPLDFPKAAVGIECDINFSNHLALHNTTLLRCYSHCDVRVKPMVIFVKTWAKQRKINSAYHGTLSSYGYVLMVLHFLANVTKPAVIPNLQLEATRRGQQPKQVDGCEVNFWDDEETITRLNAEGSLMQPMNRLPLGMLLRGFFDYYARQGSAVPGRGFNWTADVLSLRTAGGLVSKQSKGWTGAKTTVVASKGEIRHRYLMAIEDPFELEHNVARTVVHDGIVKIRDEFRRAWGLIASAAADKNQFFSLLAEAE